jgi:amino acid transporter
MYSTFYKITVALIIVSLFKIIIIIYGLVTKENNLLPIVLFIFPICSSIIALLIFVHIKKMKSELESRKLVKILTGFEYLKD